MPGGVDPSEGEERSGGRHSALQFHQIRVRGVQKRAAGVHLAESVRPDVGEGADKFGASGGKLPNFRGSVREGEEHYGGAEHSGGRDQDGQRARVRDQDHRHLGLPQTCVHTHPGQPVFHTRQQLQVRHPGQGRQHGVRHPEGVRAQVTANRPHYPRVPGPQVISHFMSGCIGRKQ